MKFKKYFNFACTVEAKEVPSLIDLATKLEFEAPNFEIILLCTMNNKNALIKLYTKLADSDKLVHHYNQETIIHNDNYLMKACQNTVKVALSKLDWYDVVGELIEQNNSDYNNFDDLDKLDLLDDISLDEISNRNGFGEVARNRFSEHSGGFIDF